ncbi:hypothetical protein TREES_T100002857 [Tupaia chinensis]|uniref:Uncharacterized protein n=1 Tax=Tupaia chinensis TaxID=246437 RepID=L9KVE2_TUPCH|nr:hypothetical protein TREES_T100002857 [Tupaia chinensis]
MLQPVSGGTRASTSATWVKLSKKIGAQGSVQSSELVSKSPQSVRNTARPPASRQTVIIPPTPADPEKCPERALAAAYKKPDDPSTSMCGTGTTFSGSYRGEEQPRTCNSLHTFPETNPCYLMRIYGKPKEKMSQM